MRSKPSVRWCHTNALHVSLTAAFLNKTSSILPDGRFSVCRCTVPRKGAVMRVLHDLAYGLGFLYVAFRIWELFP